MVIDLMMELVQIMVLLIQEVVEVELMLRVVQGLLYFVILQLMYLALQQQVHLIRHLQQTP